MNMMMNMNHCVRCEYDWDGRVEGRPKNCPNCKSPRWDQVRVSLADAQRANAAVSRAIKAGTLIRQTVCEKCGGTDRVQAHHEDYIKQLDVEWLCLRCHKGRHSHGNTLVDTTTSLRPQFNLRFRSAEQFVQFRDIAAARGLAVNEWLLRQAEASEDVALGLAAIAGLNRAEARDGQGSAVSEIKEAGQENRATRKQSRNVGGEKVGVARPQEAEAVNPIETDAVGTTGCKVTVSRLMAGRPAHAGNCQCFTCKPPKEK